jgi:hypothetical protein
MKKYLLPKGTHCHMLKGQWPDEVTESDLWTTAESKRKAMSNFRKKVADSVPVPAWWVSIDQEDVSEVCQK